MKNKTIDKVLFFAVFIPIALLVIFILLTIYIYSSSSNGNPLHNPDNWVVGEYGEPPKIHEELFNETYTILYSDYISAINLIFDFKNERNFDVFNFTQCFNASMMH